MSLPDIDINRKVRQVMVQHWIDLGRISVRTTAGRVTIRGSLERIAGVPEPLTTSIVESIFEGLRRVKDILSIRTELDNWSNSSGRWKLARDTGTLAPHVQPQKDQPTEQSTFEIKDKES